MKGIKNIGNTCYINSILQSLSYNIHLINYLNKYIINIESDKNEHLCIELYKIIKELNRKNDITSIIPKTFLKLLEKLWKQPIDQQQDSCDVLQYILDISISYFNNTNFTFNITNDNLINLSIQNKISIYKNQLSDFNNIFYGQKLYIIKCNNCNHINYLFEVFNILNISIENCNNTTIIQCLDNYFNPFIAENYICDKCQSINVIHQYFIFEAPKTLTISLKRFNNNLTKLNYNINNLQFISINKYLYNNYNNHLYTTFSLYSIINHYGEYNGGHYISLINNNNNWFSIDDDNINKVIDDNIITNNNYILFYNM